MRFRTGLAGAEFTLFARFGATSRATGRKGLFRFGGHKYTMQPRAVTRCSIVITISHESREFTAHPLTRSKPER